MIDPILFFKAMGIGLAVAAPVGPMGLLCMRRTLTQGWRQGLAIGGGIAIGDGTYGLVAASGLASVSQFMLAHQAPLHITAGLFLIYLGLKTFWTKQSDVAANVGAPRGWLRDLATSILLTLTNPPTIIMFAAVFTALAPAGRLDAATAAMTVAGVFTGSLLWWCFLVAMVSGFRHAVGHKARSWIDRVAGVILAGLGLVEIRRAV